MRNPIHIMTIARAAIVFAGICASVQAASTTTVSVPNLPCTFEATSWAMTDTEVTAASGLTAPAVTLNITKPADNCSPILFVSVAQQTNLGDVALKETTQSGDTRETLLTLTLHGTVATKYETTGTSASGPSETISLAFQSFTTLDGASSSSGGGDISVQVPDLGCTFSASSWTIGTASSRNPNTFTLIGASTPTNLVVTKQFDACSASLVQALTDDRVFRMPLKLTQVDKTGATTEIELGPEGSNGSKYQPRVVNYQALGSSTTGIPETVAFSYGQITIQRTPPSTDGILRGSIMKMWDFNLNRQ